MNDDELLSYINNFDSNSEIMIKMKDFIDIHSICKNYTTLLHNWIQKHYHQIIAELNRTLLLSHVSTYNNSGYDTDDMDYTRV